MIDCDFCNGGFCGLCTLPQCPPDAHGVNCVECLNCGSCGASEDHFCATCTKEGDVRE